MDPVFTLPYAEYMVVNEILKLLHQKEGYSAYLPFSRQQKGVDFMILKGKKNSKFQVKASRAYEGYKGQNYQYSLWFYNFFPVIHPLHADFYCLFSMYHTVDGDNNKKGIRMKWKPIILCFSKKDIERMRKNKIFRITKNNPSQFVYIEFDHPEYPVATRGFNEPQDWRKHLLNKKITDIQKFLS